MTRAIVDRLRTEGLTATTWSNGPGDRYAAHTHAYDKVLVVASGSIVFERPDRGDAFYMAAGDRLDLPAGATHAAVVGSDGVVCLEAHLERGSLGRAPAHRVRWAAASETADGTRA